MDLQKIAILLRKDLFYARRELFTTSLLGCLASLCGNAYRGPFYFTEPLQSFVIVLLYGVFCMALCLTITKIVHADEALGDRAYWKTHPIGPINIVISKFVLSMMPLLPMAMVDAFAGLHIGAGIGAVAISVFGRIALLTATYVLPVIALSSNSKTTASTFAGLLLYGALCLLWIGRLTAGRSELIPVAFSLVLSALAPALASGYLIFATYFQRSRIRSWVIAAITIMMCFCSVFPQTLRFWMLLKYSHPVTVDQLDVRVSEMAITNGPDKMVRSRVQYSLASSDAKSIPILEAVNIRANRDKSSLNIWIRPDERDWGMGSHLLDAPWWISSREIGAFDLRNIAMTFYVVTYRLQDTSTFAIRPSDTTFGPSNSCRFRGLSEEEIVCRRLRTDSSLWTITAVVRADCSSPEERILTRFAQPKQLSFGSAAVSGVEDIPILHRDGYGPNLAAAKRRTPCPIVEITIRKYKPDSEMGLERIAHPTLKDS